MNKKLTLFGLIVGLCLIGTSAPMDTADAGEAKVIATIQTGPEWEPLERGILELIASLNSGQPSPLWPKISHLDYLSNSPMNG